MLKRIHVNRHHIAANRKDGGDRPCFTVKTYKTNDYAHRVEIHGPCEMVYNPDNPLNCGAVAWMETKAEVTLHVR